MKRTLVPVLAAAALLAACSSNAPEGSSTPPAAEAAPTGHAAITYPVGPAAAKDYIERLGYSDVQNLREDSDGWHATALRDGRPVNVDLDREGTMREE